MFKSIWRLTPRYFLPPTKPRSLPRSVPLNVWLSMPTFDGAGSQPVAEGVHDPLPYPAVAPMGEVVLDGALGGQVGRSPKQVVWPHLPLAFGVVGMEDRFDGLTQVVDAGSAEAGYGDQWLDEGPLRVGDSGGVGLTNRGMHRRR